MAIVRIEPFGCVERKGLVQIRFAMYLEPNNYGYEKHHVQVPVFPRPDEPYGGYAGELYPEGHTLVNIDGKPYDVGGQPVSVDNYNMWRESLPKVWQNNPFHNHFVYVEPETTDEEIKALMAFHLPNFYEAWRQEYGEIKGGMRHGWDTKTRRRPKCYVKDDHRKALVEARLVSIKGILTQIKTNERGEIFPATEIDIGTEAIDRPSFASTGYTYVMKGNPANDTGTIDTVEMWLATQQGEDCKVATFIDEGSNNLSTRDWELIGTVTADSKQTFSGLDMDVETGDLLGIYLSSGTIEQTLSGEGIYSEWNSDQIPCSSNNFGVDNDRTMSLYGTGETLAVPAGGGGPAALLVAQGEI